MKIKGILTCLVFLTTTKFAFSQLMSVGLSGFNQDVIANGSGGAAASISLANGFDNASWSFVAQDFNGATACALPMSRLFTSAITAGLPYQLASYTGNNALHFPTAGVPMSLIFNVAQSASEVYVLGCSGSGASVADITVNFQDLTSQTFTANNFPDWFNTAGAVNAVGRVSITNTLECAGGGPNLAQIKLTLSVANQNKPISGITVTKTSGGMLGILAVSINFTGVVGSSPTTIPPIASYSYNDADTIWINAATTVVNTSANSSRNYWDIIGYNSTNKNGPYAAYPENRECKSSDGINDCFIDTTNNAVNFRYTFHQPGYYRLKLVALNAFGFDTYIDTIYVDTPSTKPVADFFADRKIVGVYDFANLFDLSSNGPTGWSWYTVPEYYNPLAPFYNNFSPSAYEQNPVFNANEGGIFDVCLVASNARGSDTMCKPGYMKVISGYEVCKGTSTAKDTIAYENEGSAKLYTVGDTYIPTLIGSCSKGFTIYSCSDTVTLYIDRLKLRSNVTAGVSDSVRIRIGDVNGAVVARFGGSNINTRSVKVPGGVAYIQTVLANNSNTPPGDSGYVIRWDAPMATYPKPTASFNMPDTVYDGYTVQFVNTSTGTKMSFAWDTNGDNVYGIDNPSSGIDSIGTNPTRTYAVFSPYKAKVCLKATNCKGSDTTCKTVQFLPVNAVPSADFTVNRISGFTTDTFRFTDMSQNGPNDWEWTFVPNNVAFLSGTSAFSQNPIVLLNSAIAYDISLTATNQAGSNTKTKTSFVSAIAFSTPGCSGCPTSNGIPFMPSTIDVGITRVVLGEIDTTTSLNSPIYHPLYPYKKATVYRGVSYTVSTSRGTVNEPMSTRVWIDFNRNTTFGDEAAEVVISENGQHKVVTTNSFKVPDAAPLGTTRMRIGVTYGNTSITDRVASLGCFEDFGIEVGIDRVKPVILLIGNSIEKVELNNSYNEKGVIGMDNLEGDISSRYKVYGKVDTAKLGYYILKYIVTDLYGNVSDTISRTVQVEINQTGPSITLNGSDTMDIEVFHSFTDPGASAISNTGSDLTPFISTTGEVDTAVLGNYVITYSITDQFGFNATKYRLVRVKDITIPVIQTNAGTTTITHQVGLPYMDPVTVTDNYWKNVQAIRTGIINPQTPGSYNLIYDAVDGSGNHAASYFVTVVVKDLVAPEVLLKGDNPMTVDVFTVFNDPGVTATDNYYPNVFPVITGLPNMTVLGNYTVTYTVTDGAGNTTVVTRVVKVVDRTAPEIQLLGGNPFEQVRFKPFVEPGVKIKDNYYSDATLQVYLQIDSTNLVLSRPGISIITYQVTDPSGNKSLKVERYVNVVEVTGLKDISANHNLMVYPNPSNGLFTVTNKTTVSMESIRVVDLLGKEVLNQRTTNNEVAVDLTTAPKGLYMIIVKDTNGNEQLSKIVVE